MVRSLKMVMMYSVHDFLDNFFLIYTYYSYIPTVTGLAEMALFA